jgi:hypothetical protein
VPGKLNRRPWVFCGWGSATCGGGHGPATPSGGARGRRKPDAWGVFDMPALEGLASEPGSGQPELGPERPVALFDVGVWFEPG